MSKDMFSQLESKPVCLWDFFCSCTIRLLSALLKDGYLGISIDSLMFNKKYLNLSSERNSDLTIAKTKYCI